MSSKMSSISSNSGSGSPASRYNSKDRIASYEARRMGISREEREDLIPALGLRSYHLPGYGACGDWMQYMGNNHPLFGMCCRHRLHPVGFGMRFVHLFGSIVFGLAITNILWLWFIINEIDEEEAILTITVNGMGSFGKNFTSNLPTVTASFPSGENSTMVANDDETAHDVIEYSVTQGMFLLWTVGGGLHALFDNTIYYITVCACCLPGQSFEHLQRYSKFGNYLAVWTVVLVAAVASLVVLIRATLENASTWDLESVENATYHQGQQQVDEEDDTLTLIGLRDVDVDRSWDAYEFLISYAIEMALALLVYYPLIGTILFSGVLGCGRLPVLGGRPYEVRQEKEKQRRDMKRKQRRSGSTHRSTDNV